VDADKTRRTEEQLLSDFFENAAVGLHWVGPDGTILRANRAELELLGYSKEEYIGRHIAEFHADRAVIEDILEKLSCGHTLHSYEARLRCKDGSIKHVLISSNVLREDGKFVHTRCFTRDITELKRAQEALRKSENLKAAVVDAALDAIVAVDHEGKVSDFNRAAEKMFGYSRNDALGKALAELIIPERLRHAHREGLARYLVTGEGPVLGKRIEQLALHADGHEFPVELSISVIPGISPPAFTATLRDITGVKQAVAAQTRLAAIIESSDDGIIGKTLDGIITSWNKGAEVIFGHREEEMVGQPILKIIPSERHGEEEFILGRLRQGERIEHYETVRVHKDGHLIDVSLSTSPIRDQSGKVVGASKIVRDITARKRAEEILRRRDEELRILTEKAAQEREQLLSNERVARAEAERMSAMKDEFLATLSHELRTPLSAILGWAQVLRRGSKDEADLQKGLDTIERNARMQTQLIEDLLDMSRITSGQVRLDIQPVLPDSVVEAALETVRPSAEAKGIRIEKVLDPLAGPVSGDPARLQQVIWNLLSNAVKFTPKNGKIQVLLERVNSHIEISVADTGIGIRPEFLPHVFERFRQADSSTTREYAGLGLGLSIVKHLVELHGGTVHAESAGEGRGATFVVHLPVSVVRRDRSSGERVHPRTADPSSSDFKVVDLSEIKVLVVDDEADARDLIRRIVEECGAEVLTAGSAMEALQMVEQDRPHVLVSDIGMPGVDGYEFLRRVRALGEAKGGKVHAIALTAFARSEDRTRALRAGFLYHVSKPVEPSELIATLASAAGRTSG
jgi:PAS domain S-box-containing protein